MLEIGRIIAAATLIASLSGCESDPCGSTGTAELMAEKFVKRELRDPDSAQFDKTVATRDAKDACIYMVTGKFSAKNGFGGVTPGVFVVEIRKKRGENSWSAVDLLIQ